MHFIFYWWIFNYKIVTFLISAMISFGSLDDVVFILQVKRNDRGLISPFSLTILLYYEICLDKIYCTGHEVYIFSAKSTQNSIIHLLTYPISPPIGRCTNCGTGLGCGQGLLIPGLSNGLKVN